MKIKLHITLSDAESNMMVTLQHTEITYPTKTIQHIREIEIPDPPARFAIDRITIAEDAA